MRVPVFEEITPEDFKEKTLKKAFKESRVGRCPCYLSLEGRNQEDAGTLARRISKILHEGKFSTRFPYPFFLITEYPIQLPNIEIISNHKDLPAYYFRKVKKLNSKELALLNKVLMLNEKISNLSLHRYENLIYERSRTQKKLYEFTKERSFYEEILNGLGEPF